MVSRQCVLTNLPTSDLFHSIHKLAISITSCKVLYVRYSITTFSTKVLTPKKIVPTYLKQKEKQNLYYFFFLKHHFD